MRTDRLERLAILLVGVGVALIISALVSGTIETTRCGPNPNQAQIVVAGVAAVLALAGVVVARVSVGEARKGVLGVTAMGLGMIVLFAAAIGWYALKNVTCG